VAPPRRIGTEKADKLPPTLSEQTHQQILDYFKVAADNSEHPAIRDAALDLIRDKTEFQHKQEARLSPTLTMTVSVCMIVLAGVSSWWFYDNYSERVALALSIIIFGLALVGVCLLAVFSGNLSQSNFVRVISMVWSKITSMLSRSKTDAGTDSSESEDSNPED